jgi:cysteine-rich repeat protein
VRLLGLAMALLLLAACSAEKAARTRSAGAHAGDSGGPAIGAAGADRGGAADALEAGAAAAGRASVPEPLHAGAGGSAGTGDSSTPAEANCRDGVDDDGDGRTDCADPDCAAACAQSCEDVPELAGAGVLGSLSGQPDDFDLSCGSGGPELVYRYSAKRDGELSVRLSTQAELRVGIRSGCGSGRQLACGDATVTVPVDAGVDLFLVVEGTGSDHQEATFALSIAGCGDGVLDPGEQCDDGGQGSGDGCSEACTLESSEGPGNDTVARADELRGERYFGSIEGKDDADVIHLAVESRRTEIRVTSLDLGGGCSSGVDTTLELLSSDGEPLDVGETGPAAGSCAALVVSGLAPDDYYLRVASSSASSFAYMLNVTLATCGNAVRELGELCDDGNTTNGDGCRSDCTPD